MTIPAAIRELLACPKCHGPLLDAEDGRTLECAECAVRYPVRDGIPVMLIDQAEAVARGVS